MARVFISYRRADGQYAVGWIEERLRRLDEVTHLHTAFRDNRLRVGDDLSDRLADEVRDCDVLIAVIGPHWRGVRDDGSARIEESLDWVGREIASALEDGKRIIPVLIAGAEPLQPTDLPEPIRPFADLLAVRFEGIEDLTRLEHDLRGYLDDLDRERARVRGLDRPIVVPSARQPAWVWLLALVVGVVAGVVGYLTVILSDQATDAWRVLSAFEIGVWAALCVLGLSYFHRVLAGVIQIRWPTVAKTAAVALALLGLTVVAFAPGAGGEVALTALQGVLAVGLMSPWIVVMLGATWSTTSSGAIRDRAEVIAIHHRGLRTATPLLSLVLALPVVTTAALYVADGPLDDGRPPMPSHVGLTVLEGVSLIAFGTLLTLIVVAALQYGVAALQHDSELVRLEISDLAPAYQRHVGDVLVERGLDLRLALVWMAMIPVVTGLLAALAGWTWT